MFDYPLAITVHRLALLRIVAGLLVMLGEGATVRRHVHLAVLAVLRPAEAAVRRLIAIAAVGVAAPPRHKRAKPTGSIPQGPGPGERMPVFRLFDPRRRVGPVTVPARGFPNVRYLDGEDAPVPGRQVTSPGDPVPTARVSRRLRAMLHALETIPAQARRLARLQSRMDRPIRPMRPGRPPGHVARGRREIDVLLADCHELALMALAEAPP